jgi:ferric iron reductase protein FhuF
MLFIGAILLGFYGLIFLVMREIANRNERVTETWGCGYPIQNSKMEYTASGFSEPIVTILKAYSEHRKRANAASATTKTRCLRKAKPKFIF